MTAAARFATLEGILNAFKTFTSTSNGTTTTFSAAERCRSPHRPTKA
jgi:hypothetical protein